MLDKNRRIIEALRTGVPTREVAELLGSGQVQLESRYKELLAAKRRGTKISTNGFVCFGGFGTGKSHTLEVFSKIALDSNCVVSRATISNNLKLGSPLSITNALLSSTQTSRHQEDGFESLLADALARKHNFSGFVSWLQSEVQNGQLSPGYIAIAKGLASTHYAAATFDKIVDFLKGLAVLPDLKRLLRHGSIFPRGAERVNETTKFLSRLFMELGYSGWVVLFDELELIRLLGGKIARGKSYSELANWMGFKEQRAMQGLIVIGCMTAGYVQERIDWSNNGECELETIPARLLDSKSAHLHQSAKYGMEVLQKWDADPVLHLNQPTGESLAQVQNVLRDVYEKTYGIQVEPISIERSSGNPMRMHIRRWIISWDLKRQGQEVALRETRVDQAYVVTDDDEDDD